MKQFEPITLEQAIDRLVDASSTWPVLTEAVSLSDAGGRFLAEEIIAPDNLPPFDRSLVDGYAIRLSSVAHSTATAPALLKLAGRVEMGASAPSLPLNEAIYVPTGGMLPAGTEAVVMLEYARELGQDVLLTRDAHLGENCSFTGEDIKKGEEILERGTRLGRGEIGVLAALNFETVEVIKKPRVAILSTGDELAELGEDMKPGQVRDVNRYSLAQAVLEVGGEVVLSRLIGDRLELLGEAIREASCLADITLISGGSSVGAKDFTQPSIEDLSGGDVLINGLLIKPGKPTLAGVAKNHLIIGLPGHPVSALRVFEALVEPYLERHYHLKRGRSLIPAFTSANFPSSPGLRTFQSVTLEKTDQGYEASPLFSKSAWISELVRADGVVILSEEVEGLEANTSVWVERKK